MKLDLFTDGLHLPLAIIALWTLIWVGVLARILDRSDFDTLNKLLWVIVVIFVPFFGVLLYWYLAPAVVSARKDSHLVSGSDVAGTPWANNPNFKND